MKRLWMVLLLVVEERKEKKNRKNRNRLEDSNRDCELQFG